MIHVLEASSSATITIRDWNTNQIIPHHLGSDDDMRSYKGLFVVAYLKDGQRVRIAISEPYHNSKDYYPIHLDYLADSWSGMSTMDWIEAAINRQYKGNYEAAITAYVEDLNDVADGVASSIVGIQAADTVISLGTSALVPKPGDAGKFLIDTDKLWQAQNLLSSANTMQKTVVACLPDEDVNLNDQRLSKVVDSLSALGQFAAGNPLDAYQTIIVNFTEAAVYLFGVFFTSTVERGINAQFLVNYLIAEHVGMRRSSPFSENEVRQLTSEWAEYTENQCSWREDKAGCGLDNYNEDIVVELYNNTWISLVEWAETRAYTENYYWDVDRDGIENSVDAQPNTWNDTPPPPLGDHRLSVTTTGTGSGRVSSNPAGLSCTTSCDANFEEDSIVWLSVQATSGSSFVGWSGACSGSGVTCAVTMSADKSVSAEFETIVDDDDDSTPYAERVDPVDIVNYVRQGQRQKIKVLGSDSDGHLSHVIYSASDSVRLSINQAVTSQSNNIEINDTDLRDNFDNPYEDSEYVYIDFTGYNNNEPVYVYATVYDSVAKDYQVYWKFYIEPVYDPVLSAPSPPTSEILNIPLVEQEFRVSMSDEDDNAGDIEWWLNGLLIQTTSTNGGGTFREYSEDIAFHLYNQGIYTLEARITDDDGISDSISWTVHAGFSNTNNAPVITEEIHLDTEYGEELPHTLFRAGKVYQFQAEAADVDNNLKRNTCLLNGVIINEYNDSDGDRDDMHPECQVSFKDAGENILTFEFADAYDATVSTSMAIHVLPEDGTTGGAPSITEAYPAASTLWLQTDKDLAVELLLADPDGDQEGVIVSIDNIERERIEFESCSEEVIVDSTLFPSQRSYSVKFTPYDAAGHLGQAKTYTVNARQLGNHQPQVAIMDLWGDGVVRAELYHVGERRAYFYYHAWDVDGDLAEVEILYNGVDPDDARDYDSYTGSFEKGFNGRDDFRANNAVSGTVTLRVTDSRGNSRSLQIPVRLENTGSGHAPQFVNHNFPEDGSHIIIPSYVAADFGRRDRLYYMCDFFDQDGDLKEYRMSINGGAPLIQMLGSTVEEQPEYFADGHSLWTRGPGEEEFDIDVDNLVRGIPHVVTIELEDFEGNITNREWTIIRGPWGSTNHSPAVDSSINFEMAQNSSRFFSVTVNDEEGDSLTAMAPDLPYGDELIHIANGQFEYTPVESRYGNVSFTINWSDGYGGTASTAVNVSIESSYYPDIDGDGMKDSWEIEHFGNLTVANATTDTDRDGYSDLQEFHNWLNNELDPERAPYNPAIKNAPSGTGYKASTILWQALPAILNSTQR